MSIFHRFNKKLFFKDRLILLNFVFCIVLTITLVLLFLYQIPRLRDYGQNGFIPLHYTVYFGIDFVAEWYNIFIIPLFSIFVIFINFFLSYIMYSSEKIMSYFLVFTASFVVILLSLASIAVLLYL